MASSILNSTLKKIKARLSPDLRHEVLDPTPMAPPVGFRPAPSLSDQIREMVRSERLAREAAEAGFETFAEADDFDIPDDVDPSSRWEQNFDPTPVSELQRLAAEDAAKASSPQPSPAQPANEKVAPTAPAGDQIDPKKEPPVAQK